MNIFLALGTLFGLFAVIIGAFGAHGLEDSLSTHALARYHTGVEYQFYHVATLLFIGLLASKHSAMPRILKISGFSFAIGILLFSGSLYLYALTGISKFGMATPIGGLAFIVGWICLFIYSLKQEAYPTTFT
ncbi:MAG: DUF423 domain-containing protein [Cocleimonas sp.]|nr:DUF423 domain-containing protein [Cocleimonas sp.]